jgi:outer membrane biosynthesis protein TonB
VQWDKEQLARTFVDVYKVTYPVGRDASGEIGNLYAVEATPTSVFIGKDGKLVELHVGELENGDFTQRLDTLLKAKYPEPRTKPKPKPKSKAKPKPSKGQTKQQPVTKQTP